MALTAEEFFSDEAEELGILRVLYEEYIVGILLAFISPIVSSLALRGVHFRHIYAAFNYRSITISFMATVILCGLRSTFSVFASLTSLVTATSIMSASRTTFSLGTTTSTLVLSRSTFSGFLHLRPWLFEEYILGSLPCLTVCICADHLLKYLCVQGVHGRYGDILLYDDSGPVL